MNLRATLLKIRLELGKALNGQTEAKTKEGATLLFDGDQIVEGATINTIDEAGTIAPAGSGVFTLEDGRVVTVENDVVISIVDENKPVEPVEPIPPIVPVEPVEPVEPIVPVVPVGAEGDVASLTALVAALTAKVDEMLTAVTELTAKNEAQEKIVTKLSKMPLAIKMMKTEEVPAITGSEITEEAIKENPALRLFK